MPCGTDGDKELVAIKELERHWTKAGVEEIVIKNILEDLKNDLQEDDQE